MNKLNTTSIYALMYAPCVAQGHNDFMIMFSVLGTTESYEYI